MRNPVVRRARGDPYPSQVEQTERLGNPANGLEHWLKARNNLPGIEPPNAAAVLDRLEDRTLPFSERQSLSESVRNQQNVGEQDSPIHTIAPNRLQRQLGSKRRGQAQLNKILCL